ncbi:asparagine synthase (glutamine-hydrolyzing) [Aestuariivivens marinum]|uniref:asparagine synthase (glutamine-hydrolyzing) n=1 Tax=Aestuariivivens marinum TaxID=2913555 RepID=UPI001F59A978|nr:asparagine synthase (glutamine-hydrolyzing) [Aestuariivivens marinum]
MCGIYITNIPFKEGEVKNKLEKIKYRGPDNTGIEKINNIILGHLRLSILDLDERSNQPFSYQNLHITFNGEIYNYLDIKKELVLLGYSFTTTSDTEVLIIGYKVWGKGVLDKINGMFAFSIYDSNTNKIFSARDRLGVKPFYYYWKEGQFEICSQMRPLISKTSQINEEAVQIYLDCRYVPSPYSIIKDIHKLKPGHWLEIDLEKGSYKTESYWDLQRVKTRKVSYAKAKEELHDLLRDAVKIRLQSDVPIGSFLSGGIDSALVTSIANEVSETKINTFCIGFENPKYDESKIAKQFSEIIDTNHTETICKATDVLALIPKLIEVYDEPFADSSALPSLLLNSVTKQHVTVALSGDGGDESFLGYNHFAWLKKVRIFYKVPLVLRKIIGKTFLTRLIHKKGESIRTISNIKSIKGFIPYIFIGFETLLKKRDISWLKHFSSFKHLSNNMMQQAADLNIKLWLENDSNVKVDRASMAYSVEVRSPFLDYRIVEFARTLPVSYRLHKKVRKRLLRDILKEYIPENVFNQPKSGFSIPLGDWIRGELKEEFRNVLNDEFLDELPSFDKEKFKNQFNQHLEGKIDYATNIWKVYVLARWYREFNF